MLRHRVDADSVFMIARPATKSKSAIGVAGMVCVCAGLPFPAALARGEAA